MNKNFVVDTNVLIDDPKSLVVLRNDVNEVSIPLEVILDLDKLKTDSKVGGRAREAIRFIYSNRDWINLISDFESEDMLYESFDGKILANIVTNYKNGILVSNDIIKEDMDILKKNALSIKDVGGTVSKLAKTWFFERLDS